MSAALSLSQQVNHRAAVPVFTGKQKKEKYSLTTNSAWKISEIILVSVPHSYFNKEEQFPYHGLQILSFHQKLLQVESFEHENESAGCVMVT